MKEKIFLICIIVLAAVLRFYTLGSNPLSLDWDEASQGYNAYSLLKTGRDEYGNFLPLAIRSFDDYKPPLYTYITVPSVAVFGLTPFAVRLPAAIIGTLCVPVVYFLTKELVEKKEGKKKSWHPIALLASCFLAISPWHLQFSRAAFEGNLGVFFFALGVLLFLKGLKEKWWFLFASIAFIFAMYSYHSFRVVVPFFFIIGAIFYWKEVWKEKIIISFSFLLFIIGIFPILLGFFQGTSANARLSMVTIFSDQATINKSIQGITQAEMHHDTLGMLLANRRIIWTEAIVQGYFSHFSPWFLFTQGDSGAQHQAIGMGMLYLWDAPFLIIGLIALVFTKKKETWILLLLLLIAPIPASITTGTPHAVRDIGTLPYIQIIIAFGFWWSLFFVKEKMHRGIYYSFITIVCTLLAVNIVYYLHQYYIVTPKINARYWEYGYQQVFAYTQKHEDRYQHILVTYYYDQPYIYYLFFNKINPVWYQKYWQTTERKSAIRMYRKIGKYEFLPISWATMQGRKNTLIIAAPQEVPKNIKTLQKVYLPDHSVAFDIIGL